MDSRDLPSEHSSLTAVRRTAASGATDSSGFPYPRPELSSSSNHSNDGRLYHILGIIGRGGFGTVYHARLEGPDGFLKDVAVKLLHDQNPPADVLARFRDEARILGRMRDRATVSVDPPIRLNGRWAVVMELVDGVDCRRLLREHGRFPARVALEIVEEVARTLHNLYAHPDESGAPMRLLHRDIKPSNIQITPAGALKVLDFGVARAYFASRESETMSQIAGTLGYIAPERVDGIEDTCGDIYGLGIVLEELVTGRRPSRPGEDTSRLQGVAVPPEVMALAAEMHAYDPRQRPTAEEVERRCADLARRLPGPTLREWARDHAMTQPRFPPDALVGTTLSEPVPSGVQRAAATRATWVALFVTVLLASGAVVSFAGLAVIAALWYSQQPARTPAPRPPEAERAALAPAEVEMPPPAPVAPVIEPAALRRPAPPITRPSPRPSPSPAQRPAPEVAASPEAPSPPTGRVTFTGAERVQLVGTDGVSRSVGTVPAGRYQVRAQFSGGSVIPVGSVNVAPNEEVNLRCDARFQRCVPQ